MAANFKRNISTVVIAMAAMLFCSSVGAAEIPWSTNIEDSLHEAAANGQPVLLEFTADWCVFCKKMEKNTFPNPQVTQKISSNFVAVRVNADQNKGLVKDLGIKGLPAILIVSPDLKVIKRISGFQTPEALVKQLDEVISTRPTQAGPHTLANSNGQPQRPMNQPPRQQPQPQFDSQQPPQSRQPNGFQPNAVAATRPARGELEFESISQDEAPRVGSPRTQNRPIPDPAKHPFFDAPGNPDTQPAKAELANNEAESFFKTISREQIPQSSEEAHAVPAFGGLCLVSAVEDRELISGAGRYQINYRGHTLYFASLEQKEQFQASPGTYWPVLDGACSVTLLEAEKCVEGSLEFAAVFRKRIWLFSSQKAMDEFLSDPADVAQNAIELAAELQR